MHWPVAQFLQSVDLYPILKVPAYQDYFICILDVQKKESEYPWARSPQLIGAMSKIALSPPLTILCLLELLTEHLGGLVVEKLDIWRSLPF